MENQSLFRIILNKKTVYYFFNFSVYFLYNSIWELFNEMIFPFTKAKTILFVLMSKALPEEIKNQLSQKEKSILGFASVPYLSEYEGIEIKKGYNNLWKK